METPATRSASNAFAVVALVLGVLSIAWPVLYLPGWILTAALLGLAAIVVGIVARKLAQQGSQQKTIATIGMAFGAVAVGLFIVNTVLFALFP
jgi:hypothetical protein